MLIHSVSFFCYLYGVSPGGRSRCWYLVSRPFWGRFHMGVPPLAWLFTLLIFVADVLGVVRLCACVGARVVVRLWSFALSCAFGR